MPGRARPAALVAVLTVLPFVWSVATEMSAPLADAALRLVGPRYLGPYLALGYGLVLLAAVSGVLLGFAVRQDRAGRVALLPLIPIAWAFLFTGGGPVPASLWLAAGFLVALALDWLFWRRGLAPVWWWPLRAGQTAVAVVCLLLTALA
ncbi:MAG: DUF3429 domain-containing protein [Paracoccaceae bacterium]